MESNQSGQLDNNPAVFSRGGVIGRGNFIVNVIIILTILGSLYWVVSGAYFAAGEGSGARALIFQVLFAVAFVYLGTINVFKRVRDIRGTDEKENPILVGTVLLMLVPVVNVFLVIFLAFAKGAITDEVVYYAHFEEAIRNKFNSFVEANGGHKKASHTKHHSTHA